MREERAFPAEEDTRAKERYREGISVIGGEGPGEKSVLSRSGRSEGIETARSHYLSAAVRGEVTM
jgi:hypothetical protein